MQYTEFPCPGCGSPVSIGIGEVPRIVNMESVAIILVEHTTQQACNRCGVVFVPIVRGIQNIHLGLIAVPVQEQNRIVPATM